MITSSYTLKYSPLKRSASLEIPTSKSISNRLLILKETYNQNLIINKLSEANDTQLLSALLSEIKTHHSRSSEEKEINTHNCGTAFRFLCAYLCFQKGRWLLTGSEEMKNRPIKGLVDSLRSCGADIHYLEKEGFPPLKINALQPLSINEELFIDSEQSSQFVSALLLVLPLLKKDIQITFPANNASFSYIQMTVRLMQDVGISIVLKDNTISYFHSISLKKKQIITVNADWSSAAYWFTWVALHSESEIFIENLKKCNIQSDSIIEDIVKPCGVETHYLHNGVLIKKTNNTIPSFLSLNASNYLDLVPTLAVLCCGLNIKAKISGIRNLVFKESNRLQALIVELNKIAHLQSDKNTLEITPLNKNKIFNPFFTTYNDHRIAMSLSLLAGYFLEIQIENPDCVLKSYPNFWENLRTVGVNISS